MKPPRLGGALVALMMSTAVLTSCAGDIGPGTQPTAPTAPSAPSEPEPGLAVAESIVLEPSRLLVTLDGDDQESFLFAEAADGPAAAAFLTSVFGTPESEAHGLQYGGESLTESRWGDGISILEFSTEGSSRWVVRTDASEVDDVAISTLGGIRVGDTVAEVRSSVPDAVDWGVPQLLIGGGKDLSGQVDQVGVGIEGDRVAWLTARSCSCDV